MLKEAVLIGAQITSVGGIAALPHSFSEQNSVPNGIIRRLDLNPNYNSLNGVNISVPNQESKTANISQETQPSPSPEASLSSEEQKIIDTGRLFYSNNEIEITQEIIENEYTFLNSLPSSEIPVESMTIEEVYENSVNILSAAADGMGTSSNPLFVDANSILFDNNGEIQVDPTLDPNVDMETGIGTDENNDLVFSVTANPNYLFTKDPISIALKLTGSAVAISTVKDYVDQNGINSLEDLDLEELEAFLLYQQTVAFIAEAGILGPDIFKIISGGINNPIAQSTIKYLELEEKGLDWFSQEWIDYANNMTS